MWSFRKIAPVLIPLTLLFVTGLRGVDFGGHWDERFHVKCVKSSIERGVLLPGLYPYPSVTHGLMLVAATPNIVSHVWGDGGSKALLIAEIRGKAFSLKARSIFLACSALAVVFVYLTVLVWRDRVLEALLAATILGLSWEFAYHARYVAPDCVGASFGALTLLGCFGARRQPDRPAWLWLATIGAGLAFGSKWPLGLFLLPLLLTGFFLSDDRDSLRLRLLRCVKLVLGFLVVFSITTPAIVFDFGEIVRWIVLQRQVYGEGHLGYTVKAGPEHLLRILEYLVLVFPSHVTSISLSISLLAAFGSIVCVRESWRASLILLVCPVFYLLFVSSYNVMIVRNLLLVGPVIAILAAHGIVVALDAAGSRFAAVGAALCCAGLVVINGGWLLYAGESIRAPRSHFIEELADYTEARPDARFFVSPMLCEELAGVDGGMRSNYSCDPLESADFYVYLTPEVLLSEEGNAVPSNRRNLTLAMFGPHEVNFDYYSSWPSNRHIRISRLDGATDMGFPFTRTDRYERGLRRLEKQEALRLERERRALSAERRRTRP